MKRTCMALAIFVTLVAGVQLQPAQGAVLWNALKWDGTDNVFTHGLIDSTRTIVGQVYEGNNPKTITDFGQLLVGDVLVMVGRASLVNLVSWQGADDEFTFYSAFKVVEKGSGTILFGPGGSDNWDPLGMLKSDEMLRIYYEGQQDVTLTDRVQDLSFATDGTLFGGFGNRTISGTWTSDTLQIGVSPAQYLELVHNPENYPFIPVGSDAFGNVHLMITSLGLSTTDQGDWDLRGTDSLTFRLTPEPGTVTALLAMGGAAGLGLALRRRKGS